MTDLKWSLNPSSRWILREVSEQKSAVALWHFCTQGGYLCNLTILFGNILTFLTKWCIINMYIFNGI